MTAKVPLGKGCLLEGSKMYLPNANMDPGWELPSPPPLQPLGLTWQMRS